VSAAEGEPTGHGNLARAAPIAAYSILGLALVASRTVGLDHSFWTDEIMAVEDFIREGPRTILSGPNLSHELFGILAWLTSSLVGESEIALRLLSVVPFVGGVALVTAWLHVRFGALAGALFLFLATVSPLLLDITRQARGYGLAFLAMSVLVVAALEVDRGGRTSAIVAFCVAGLAGTMTLPQFGIAFLATGAVFLTVRALRRRMAIGLAASLVAIGAWYAPHIGQVRDASQIKDGVQIENLWVVTAPIDQVLLPALIWIDGTALVAGVVWLPLVLLAALVAASSPLIRARTSALVLCSGVVATIVVLWLSQAYVIPRYLSYLLVPLFVLVATGMASLLARVRSRPAILRTVAGLVVLTVLAIRFVAIAPDVMRLPREANRDAARVVLAREPQVAVLIYMRNPQNLEYYLERPAVELTPDEVVTRVCSGTEIVAYVTQPFGIPSVEVPCLSRAGTEHHRLEQYARGDEIDVWFVPPQSVQP
jgi:hypothetical protein